jgi:hypothetical protein
MDLPESGEHRGSLLPFLEEMSDRVPNLKGFILWIFTPNMDEDTEKVMVNFLSTKKLLLRSIFPSCTLTPNIFSSLASHEALFEVSILPTPRGGKRATGMLPQTLAPGSFPKIQVLTLQCSLDQLARFFTANALTSQTLTSLSIDIIGAEDEQTFRNCLDQISHSFPLLQILDFSRNADMTRAADNEEQLTYASLLPS